MCSNSQKTLGLARFRCDLDLFIPSLWMRMNYSKCLVLKYSLTNPIQEFNLQVVVFQCWNELHFQLGICSCFVNALITDEGTPFSRESDIHAAIISLMLQAANMSEEPTLFSDLTISHPENDNAKLLWHCSVFPPSVCGNEVPGWSKVWYGRTIPWWN